MNKLFGKAICVVALVLVVASLMLTFLINGSSVYARTTSLTMDHSVEYVSNANINTTPVVPTTQK